MTLTTFLLLLLFITINNCVLVMILDKKEVKCEAKSDIHYWIGALSNNIPYLSSASEDYKNTIKVKIEKEIDQSIVEGKHSLIVVHTLMLPVIVYNGIGNISVMTEEKKLNVKGVKIIGSKNINIDEVIIL